MNWNISLLYLIFSNIYIVVVFLHYIILMMYMAKPWLYATKTQGAL